MRPVSGSARSFAQDRSGNIAIILGLSFAPVVMMIGAGVDYGRIAAARGSLQQAADAAVLAVAKGIVASTTDQQARSQAQVYLTTNYRNGAATVASATIAKDRLSLCITAQAQVATTIMQIARTSTMSTQVTACAALQGGISPTDTYEIALVLDNSGSMRRSTSGTTKMEALRTAATSFVNTMFTKAPSRVKFAITPFAAGVVAVDPTVTSNRALSWIDLAGANSQHWVAFSNGEVDGKGNVDPVKARTDATAAGFTNRFDIFTKLKAIKSSWDWGGCFEQPVYPLNVADTTPTTLDPETLFVPYLAPDEPDTGYDNDYIDDDGSTTTTTRTSSGKKGKGKKTTVTSSTCSDVASGDWSQLTHVCKYKVTAAAGGGDGPNSFCPDSSTQTIMQLNATQTTVTTTIGQLVANGNTNLHEGFMWGWRTISPNPPFSAGRAYATANNHKVIVFMTDGFNNWSSAPDTVTGSSYEAAGYYSYNGTKNKRFPDGTAGNKIDYQTALNAASGSWSDYHDKSREMQDELTLESCANAKAAGVEIFTIGFSIPSDPIDDQGLTLLKNCATNKDHYFAATDAASLNLAFSTIGTGLGSLRLTQ
ncbi:pilus assembly protein [Methylosinus sp. H3A]|uniref:TadE/TadG family type IV pilus assembly protein n=1 Tax=Methylosinus sp. H3A TaxID=2785786 RepID=UPI0018C2AF67|nr:TadE/TadG family type IV pilus assembly protein [Methylosinus sp. H3A]MBG0811844.1 pilus assembly protein [Methylosinus sp. H3A]